MLYRLAVMTFFLGFVIVQPAFAEDTKASAETATLRIAVFNDSGVSAGVKNVLKVLEKRPSWQVERLKAKQIQEGALEKFDVVIFPGGSGSKQGKALGEKGREQVQSFVKKGGGLIGICAGAYLATCDYSWSLHVLNAKVVDRKNWARGWGDVAVNISKSGHDILGSPEGEMIIYYHQGPLLAPAGNPTIPDYKALAIYEGEIAKKGATKGVMPGTTAIAAGAFGEGRVLCFSPHPERTDALHGMVQRAVEWVAQK